MNVPRAKPDFLALCLAYAMGKPSAGVLADAKDKDTAVLTYQHFLTYEEDEATLPTASIHHVIDDDNIEELTGSACNDLRLAVQLGSNRMVSLDSNWVIGKRTKLTAAPQIGLQPTEPRMNGGFSSIFLSTGTFDSADLKPELPIGAANTNSTLSGGGSATITQLANRARSLELTYNNNINADSLFRLDSGYDLGAMTRGRPAIGLTMNFNADKEDIIGLIDAGTHYSMEWIVNPMKMAETVGTGHKAQTVPSVHISTTVFQALMLAK